MNFPEVYSATGMMELIQKIGFLPLLDSGIEGFSAEDIVAEDCGYVTFPERFRPSISKAASPNRLQEVLRNRSLPPRCLRHRSLQCRYQGGEEADLLNQIHHACC